MLNYCGILWVCFPTLIQLQIQKPSKTCFCVLNTSMPHPSQSLVHMATVRIKTKACECLERPGTCRNTNSTSIYWADPPSSNSGKGGLNTDLLVNIPDPGILVVTVFGGHPVLNIYTHVNYNRHISYWIWCLAVWLANVWSSLQCRVLPFQSIW